MGKRTKYEIGQRYGRLVLTKQINKGSRHSFWDCICECGNTRIVRSTYLAQSKYVSCGCWLLEQHNGGFSRRLPAEVVGVNRVFIIYKNGAENRGLSFVLEKKFFKLLITQNCVYCGSSPSKVYQSLDGTIFKYNGIDRVDNERGYEEDNIVTCCETCNRAKRNKSVKEFIEWLDTLVKYRSKMTY